MRLFSVVILVWFYLDQSLGGSSLKRLREQLKDESIIKIGKPTIDPVVKINSPEESSIVKHFHRPHTAVSNIIFVHQDLVGGSVPVLLLRPRHCANGIYIDIMFQHCCCVFQRYVIESRAKHATVGDKENEGKTMNVYIKRVIFKQINSLTPISNPCWLTLFRHPHQRVMSLYHHASPSVLIHSTARDRVFSKKLHTDDDTSGSIDTQLLPSYIEQDEQMLLKYPRLRYIPQWTSWADSNSEAIEVLKSNKVLIGFMERMDEFLVQMRHRLGWKDLRTILYYNDYKAKQTTTSSSPSPSNAGVLSSTKHIVPKEWLNLLDEQDYVKTEMQFHSSLRLLYLDQVRSFGMQRLETETNLMQKMSQKFLDRCLRKSSPSYTVSNERGSKYMKREDGFNTKFGGFGSFGTNVKSTIGKAQSKSNHKNLYRNRHLRRKLESIQPSKRSKKSQNINGDSDGNKKEGGNTADTVFDTSVWRQDSLSAFIQPPDSSQVETTEEKQTYNKSSSKSKSHNDNRLKPNGKVSEEKGGSIESLVGEEKLDLKTSGGRSWDFDSAITSSYNKKKTTTALNSNVLSDPPHLPLDSQGSVSNVLSDNPFKEFDSSGWKSDRIKQFDYTSLFDSSSRNDEKNSPFKVPLNQGDSKRMKQPKNKQEYEQAAKQELLEKLSLAEKEKFFKMQGNRVIDKKKAGIFFPGPRNVVKGCETTRSGLITKCTDEMGSSSSSSSSALRSSRNEFLLQCMLHTFDQCSTHPELLGSTCKA